MSLRHYLVRGLRRLTGSRFSTLRRWDYWRRRLRPALSYSQTGEDMILRGYLIEPSGTYIDVGAADPVRGSNTYFLYARGWSGICIDPIAANVAEFRRVRPRDRTIEAVCSNSGEPLLFHEFSDPEYSTVNPAAVAEALAEPGVTLVSTKVMQTVALSALGLKATPTDAALLAIDVEGHEMEVLLSNDWHAFEPRVICVEELVSPIAAPTLVSRFLDQRGYSLVGRTRLSSIYLHRTIAR